MQSLENKQTISNIQMPFRLDQVILVLEIESKLSLQRAHPHNTTEMLEPIYMSSTLRGVSRLHTSMGTVMGRSSQIVPHRSAAALLSFSHPLSVFLNGTISLLGGTFLAVQE